MKYKLTKRISEYGTTMFDLRTEDTNEYVCTIIGDELVYDDHAIQILCKNTVVFGMLEFNVKVIE